MRVGQYIGQPQDIQVITARRTMAAIVKLVAPSQLLLQPEAKEKRLPAREKGNAIEPSRISEPERLWWKLSPRIAWPKSAIIDVLVLGLFLVFALVAILDCFAELSHLLQSDAIQHVATRIANSQ
jgi:hypothetical protein